MKLKKETKHEDSNQNHLLDGVVDIHIHTSPDIRPRFESDIDAALNAKNEHMHAIVLKSHVEPTTGRAKIASKISQFPVFGGVVLNNSVGGLNPDAVSSCAELGGKFVWLPTTSVSSVEINMQKIEEIIHVIADNNMVLLTGHLKAKEILPIIDIARSQGIWKIVVNHPFASVVSATLDEQVEMSKYAYLEHCYVTCMKLHNNLDPIHIVDSIKKIGADRCLMATDFGQEHNPSPVNGMKMYIKTLKDLGIKNGEITKMSVENPKKLIYS